MAKVLFGWEFGGGLGHLTVLLPLAKALADRHEPVFVVKTLAPAARLLAEEGELMAAASLLQAPRWPTRDDAAARKAPVHSLADKLMLDGYNNAALLHGNARSWRDILRLVQPVLAVGDFSPTLFLAARGLVPTVAVGIPFGLPPAGRPLPPIRPWEKAPPPASQAAERDILRTVREVQTRLGRPPVRHLGDLFNGDRTFPCTIPEFDPYARYRAAPTPLPVTLPTLGPPPPVAERPEGRCFVYLPADNPHLLTTFEALRKLGLGGDVYVPGLPAPLRQRYGSPHLIFHDRPLDLAQVLPAARVAIHHGGHGISYAALRAGTPQLVLVNNLERLVTAYGLDRLGCAVILNADGKLEVGAMADYLRRLLTRDGIHRAAATAAETLAARQGETPVRTILAACEDALAR